MEISIILLTYNHERYVRQAMDSILKQKIKVSYEIIILDDASSDGTPQILKEYKRKYPELIHLYLKKVNRCFSTRNAPFMLSKASGKYVAFIEGDDYWIDDTKVQQQYDFLENHPEFSACTTGVKIVDENDNEIFGRTPYYQKEDHVYTIEDFRQLRMPGRTVAFFAKNIFSQRDLSILYKADRMMGDITLFMLCALEGNIYQLDRQMSAYRYVCKDGGNNFNSIQKENIHRSLNFLRYWINLENYIIQNHNIDFSFVRTRKQIIFLANKYPVKVMVREILKSENRRKYLRYLAAGKLMTSPYALDREETGYKIRRWSDFVKERKPIVIFGVGHVAAEYLDQFAWKNNVLFLVDNDVKKQNCSYKGYLVKKPEEIKNFKDKVIVLITNQLHEEEIREQLMDMGVKDIYSYCSMQSQRLSSVVAQKIIEMGEQ